MFFDNPIINSIVDPLNRIDDVSFDFISNTSPVSTNYTLVLNMSSNKYNKFVALFNGLIDMSVEKIVIAAKKTGASVVGPIPLPTERQVYTILRAVHKYKDSREQFEIRTHKRLIDIKNPTKETVEQLRKLDLPSGVDIDIKL